MERPGEVEQPLCSGVGPAHEVFTEGYLQLWFIDAKTETIDQIPGKLFEVLRSRGGSSAEVHTKPARA